MCIANLVRKPKYWLQNAILDRIEVAGPQTTLQLVRYIYCAGGDGYEVKPNTYTGNLNNTCRKLVAKGLLEARGAKPTLWALTAKALETETPDTDDDEEVLHAVRVTKTSAADIDG